MSFKNKIKRTVKLGVVCLATYYCARTCNNAVFGQNNEMNIVQKTQIGDTYQTRKHIDERDTIREMGYTTLR